MRWGWGSYRALLFSVFQAGSGSGGSSADFILAEDGQALLSEASEEYLTENPQAPTSYQAEDGQNYLTEDDQDLIIEV